MISLSVCKACDSYCSGVQHRLVRCDGGGCMLVPEEFVWGCLMVSRHGEHVMDAKSEVPDGCPYSVEHVVFREENK